MITYQGETWIEGLGFPEGLRWHDGRLWFSDFHTRTVNAVSDDGRIERQAFIPGQPSGLGFRADGTALVVSMLDRNLIALDGSSRTLVATLAPPAAGPVNDMYVDAQGRAYVSGFGYEAMYEGVDPSRTTPLVFVDENGPRFVGDPLHMPNGITASADGRLLVVSETTAQRLAAFDVAADGSLSNYRIFADLGGHSPDGLAMDSSGAVWVSCYLEGRFLLVREGGELLAEVSFPGHWATACALGGADGRTLYCSLADTDHARMLAGVATGYIARATVGVPR